MAVSRALILCAGTGTRMYPITKEIPKHLLPINGELLYSRIVRQLNEAGINDIVNNWHEVEENEVLGTGGSVRKELKKLKEGDSLLVWFGDVFIPHAEIKDLIDSYKLCKSPIMLLSYYGLTHPFTKKGIIYTNKYKKKWTLFLEGHDINSGVLIVNKSLLKFLDVVCDLDGALEKASKDKELEMAYIRTKSKVFDIGTFKVYDNAIAWCKENE